MLETLSSNNTPIVIDAPITLNSPNSLLRSNASKINNLYEVSHFNEGEKTFNTQFSLVNPYLAFAKPASFSPIRSIKELIQHTPKEVKDYVQSTCFDQHPIFAT